MTLGRYTTEPVDDKSLGYWLDNGTNGEQTAAVSPIRGPIEAQFVVAIGGRIPETPKCKVLSVILMPKLMSGFNGMRVLSFESRRAREIAQLITNNGGVPMVAPSTRDVAESPDQNTLQTIHRLLAGEFDAIIFMTGVGARALVAAAESLGPREQLLEALRKTHVVVRGPKPSAVMRELSVPISVTVPEPNTWREIVQALNAHREQVPLQGRNIAVQEHGEPSPELYAALREKGAEVIPIHVYRWELPDDLEPLRSAITAIVNGQVDLVVFTSSVQLVHAARVAEDMGVKDRFMSALKKTAVASIGPTTSETLREHGLSVEFEPSHPKMGFLIKEAAERSAELVGKKTAK
jgi:uroporphyrinogen-III synthase